MLNVVARGQATGASRAVAAGGVARSERARTHHAGRL